MSHKANDQLIDQAIDYIDEHRPKLTRDPLSIEYDSQVRDWDGCNLFDAMPDTLKKMVVEQNRLSIQRYRLEMAMEDAL